MRADPEDVIAFVEVVGRGSFSAAARALGVPKSSVSRRLKKLEQRLSTQLLQRTTRTLQLTEAGENYYNRSRRALEELEGAERVLEGMLETPTGLLKITLPHGIEETVSDLLDRYLERFPEVRLVSHVTNAQVDLVREGFDIALRAGMLQDSSLIARRLVSTEAGLWASASYVAKHGTPRTLAELSEHRHLVFGSNIATALTFEGPNGNEQVKLTGVLASNAFSLLFRMCLQGRGVALLPRQIADRSLPGALVRILPEYRVPAPSLYVMYPSANYLSPKVRRFVDMCLHHEFF